MSAIAPSFPVSPGRLEVKFATRTELDSPDNSYNGTLHLEFLSGDGAVQDRETLAEPWRQSPWRTGTKQVKVPPGARAARFAARINKETPGVFLIDELSVTTLALERRDDRIQLMMFTAS